MNTYIDIWSCQSSDLGTLQHYCTMLCGYFHSGPETRAHLSDCVNEQYRGLRAIYVCNRHGWLRAVSEYNSGSVCGSLLCTSTEHRLTTAGFRLLYFFKFQKCCFYVYCSALTADLKVIYVHDLLKIVGNSVSNVQIALVSSDLLRSSLFGITCFWLIPVFDFGL